MSKQAYVAHLTEIVVEWLRGYRDKYGRTWRDLGSVAAHSSSLHWTEITIEFRRRGLPYNEGDLKLAITAALDRLAGED